MAERFQVKGSTLHTKLAFARTHLGSEVEEAMLSLLRDAGIQRILTGSWYDFAIYERLLERLAQIGFQGDLERLREVGAYSAKSALSTTYQAFARTKDLDRFLELLPQLHTSMHSHGTLTLDERTMTSFVLTVRDMPSYDQGEAYVTEGFFAACARLLGCLGVRSRMKRDGSNVAYRITFASHSRAEA